MCKEVASSKKNEFKTRVQKSVPYLFPQWRQNGYNRYPIYDQNSCDQNFFFGKENIYLFTMPDRCVVLCCSKTELSAVVEL